MMSFKSPGAIVASIAGIVLFITPLFLRSTLGTILTATALAALFIGIALSGKGAAEADSLRQALADKESSFAARLQEAQTEARAGVNDEKIDALGRFASITSHELKNPLASLKNIAYYLIKTSKAEDERSKKMMTMLSTEIDRTNAMVSELSDISKSKKISKAMEDPSPIVTACLEALQLKENITVTKDIESFQANIDKDRFRQVANNLLTNARDAIGENTGAIEIRLKKQGDSFEYSVKDSGAGMDPETLQRCFEPMFSTKTKVLGLGLTVVKEIALGHHGTVNAVSEKGKGSTFTVSFPLS